MKIKSEIDPGQPAEAVVKDVPPGTLFKYQDGLVYLRTDRDGIGDGSTFACVLPGTGTSCNLDRSKRVVSTFPEATVYLGREVRHG